MRRLARFTPGAILGAAGALAMAIYYATINRGEAAPVSRRNFIRNAALGAVLIVLAQLGLGFVRFFWPNKTAGFGGIFTVSAADVPAVKGAPFTDTQGKFYLVHVDEGLLALYWKCPHLGCTVPWKPDEDRFHCPCHGSIYFYNGVKESGPAPRPLDLFKVEVEKNGDVKVNTGSPVTRGEFEPSQAVQFPA